MKRAIVLPLVLFATVFFSSAHGLELPKRASGLWEEKVSDSITPGSPQTFRMCVDEKLDDFFKQIGASQGQCSKQDVRKEGETYVIDAVCSQDDTVTRSRTVITGDFKRAYKAEFRATYEPPFMGMKDSTLVTEARLVGACPAGMRAGDVILPDGTTFNFYDLQKGILPQ